MDFGECALTAEVCWFFSGVTGGILVGLLTRNLIVGFLVSVFIWFTLSGLYFLAATVKKALSKSLSESFRKSLKEIKS